MFYVSQDLCERHEKGVLSEHQRAIQKMGQYKKKKMSATVQSSNEVNRTDAYFKARPSQDGLCYKLTHIKYALSIQVGVTGKVGW